MQLGKNYHFYFDAHPDFVSSTKNYYGSVLTDSTKSLNFRKSMLIGTRAPEPEEFENARKVDLRIVNPLEIAELGVKRVAKMIRARNKRIQSLHFNRPRLLRSSICTRCISSFAWGFVIH